MRKCFLATFLALAFLQAGPAIAVDEHHHASATAPGLALNDGRKWIADKHTADSVASMRSEIHKRLENPAKASLEDLHALGNQLQEQLQTLIRGCTMTGPAHDQLHTWISSLAPEIQGLIKSERIEAGHAAIGRISGLLGSFDEHFEPGPPASPKS